MGNGSKRIAYIDGLRAVAVLSVLLYHFMPTWLPGGFSGVDVFFVISGFVVSASLAARDRTTFKQFCIDFYSRRMSRILPALVVCLISTTVFTVLFIPDAWLSDAHVKTAKYAFYGLSNQVLARADGYFAPRAEYNPFTHTWSLGIEEQFYFVFPFFFFLVTHRTMSAANKRIGFFIFYGAAVVSFLFSVWGAVSQSTNIYFSTVARFWELAIGAALFALVSRQGGRLALSTSACFVLRTVSALAVGFGSFLSSPDRFPFPWALLPTLGTVGLIISFGAEPSKKTSWLRRTLELRPIVFIGLISYSLYLWHWPVFVLLRWTVGL